MVKMNLTRLRGDTYPIKGVMKDAEGNPVDITGATVTFGFRDSSGNLITVPGDITDGPNGAFQIVPTDASVSEIGTFQFDIQMITTEGYKITLVSGTLRLMPDVTP